MVWFCENCDKECGVIGFVGETGHYDKDTPIEQMGKGCVQARCEDCDSAAEWR